MSRITDIAKTMKTWWDEDDDPFVHRALDEIIRIDQEQLPTIEPKRGEWIDRAISIIDDMQREGIVDYQQAWEYRMRARMKGADDE